MYALFCEMPQKILLPVIFELMDEDLDEQMDDGIFSWIDGGL